MKLSGTYLVCLNGDYIFDGTLDIGCLFTISDIAEAVATEEKNITANLSVAERLLNSPGEPDIDLSIGCKNPYLCGFWKYCSRHIPEQSVFNLYRMWFSKKIAFYKKGLVAYPELLSSSEITNKTQLRQIEFALQEKGTYIEKDNIRDFLSTLSYPLYFLDFETMQPVIPKYVGTKPYAQIPFQYSLHYIEAEGGELKHKEFLADSGTDPSIIKELFLPLIQISYRTWRIGAVPDKAAVRAKPGFIQIRKGITGFVFLDKLLEINPKGLCQSRTIRFLLKIPESIIFFRILVMKKPF